jgi:hypothetical protein
LHDIEPREGGWAVAAAAGLEGFEFVEGLVELAVEVALVSHDLLHVFGGWELASVGDAGDLAELFFVGGGDAHGFAVAEDWAEVLADGVEGVGHHCGLVAGDALETPIEKSDALGVSGLEGAFGFHSGDEAGAVALPVVEVLEAGDDRRVGAEPVLEGRCGWKRPYRRAFSGLV